MSRTRSSCWRAPARWIRSTAMPASASSSCRPTPRGITISPIELMNGEHHFNEVAFDDVFVADGPNGGVLGEVGNGWHQVTAELGFERSGPERILSTATLVFSAVRALAGQDVDDRTAAELGDLMARMISLRQLSVSVARALSDGQDAAGRAAMVKDLGTRFEQDSVERVADLIDGLDPRSPHIQAAARPAGHRQAAFALVHVARWHQRGAARRGRQGYGGAMNELTQLVDDIGRRSFDARLGHRGAAGGVRRRAVAHCRGDRAEQADQQSRTPVPRRPRSCCPAWPATRARCRSPRRICSRPGSRAGGRRCAGRGAAHRCDGRRGFRRRPDQSATATDVPWPRAATVLLAARTADALHVAVVDDPELIDGHNLGGRTARIVRVRPSGGSFGAAATRRRR